MSTAVEEGRSCGVCGASIGHLRTDAKVCGKRCSDHRRRIRLRARRRGAGRACIVCGINIDHLHACAAVCSQLCRVARTRERNLASYHSKSADEHRDQRAKRREYMLEYHRKWRKEHPDRMRLYSSRQKRARRVSPAWREYRKEYRRQEWQRICSTIKALRQMGMIDGVPAKSSRDRKLIFKAARELGLT